MHAVVVECNSTILTLFDLFDLALPVYIFVRNTWLMLLVLKQQNLILIRCCDQSFFLNANSFFFLSLGFEQGWIELKRAHKLLIDNRFYLNKF